MREKIKKILIGYLPGFITGLIICGCVSVIAATYFPSNDVTYNNSNSGLQSTNVQDAIDELYGVCFPKYGSDTIIDLLSNHSDELYKDEHGDVRYYGKDPNNYVSFNNELWRIIGVIDGKIKIIRSENLVGHQTEWALYDKTGSNNWNNSDLKNYLNGEYYDSIESTYRNMISEETYYLGGPSKSDYESLTASGYYDVERSNNVYSDNPTSVKQYIGLMYPSDYGYAAGSSCLSTELYNYDGDCKNKDYLYISSSWFQTPMSDFSDRAVILDGSGFVRFNGNIDYLSVRPSLSLTVSTQIISGDGSKTSPYQLAL